MPAPRGKFLQAVLVLIVAAVVFKYVIRPPMPFSVFSLYMAVTLMAVLVYVSSDSDSWRGVRRADLGDAHRAAPAPARASSSAW